MEIYFDRISYSNDLQAYQNAAQALKRINEAFNELEIGDLSIDVLKLILNSQLSLMGEQYIAKQLITAGKNSILREAVAKIASERFERFRMEIGAIYEKWLYSLHNADFEILSVDGVINVEKLREKHTFRYETDSQKEFMAIVQRILSDIEKLREFIPDGVPLIGEDACFYVELDGTLQYNPAAIKSVK